MSIGGVVFEIWGKNQKTSKNFEIVCDFDKVVVQKFVSKPLFVFSDPITYIIMVIKTVNKLSSERTFKVVNASVIRSVEKRLLCSNFPFNVLFRSEQNE